MIQQLQNLAQEIGRTPTYAEVDNACKRGICANSSVFIDHFGTFAEAIRSAGLLPRDFRHYTKDEISKQIASLKKELGRKPTFRDIKQASREKKCAGVKVVRKLFPTATKLKALGIQLGRKNRYVYSKAKLISDLKKLGKSLNGIPTKTNIREAHKLWQCANPGTYRRVFGSLDAAIETAGLPEVYGISITRTKRAEFARIHSKLTNAELLEKLHKLSLELGRIPTVVDIGQASKVGKICSAWLLSKRFGSFTVALEQAGLK